VDSRHKQAASLLKVRVEVVDLLCVGIVEAGNSLFGRGKPVKRIILFVQEGGVLGCQCGVAFGLLRQFGLFSCKRRFQLRRPVDRIRKVSLKPGYLIFLVGFVAVLQEFMRCGFLGKFFR
jgi:hypothetical protein